MKKQVHLILLLNSVFSIILGFFVMGGGHGWVTAFFFSFLPLIVTPLIVYGFMKRKKLPLALTVITYLFISYFFYLKTLYEGEEYFESTFRSITEITILFIFTWFIPLGIAVFGLIKKETRINSTQSSDKSETK
jgi:hypothetical protein